MLHLKEHIANILELSISILVLDFMMSESVELYLFVCGGKDDTFLPSALAVSALF